MALAPSSEWWRRPLSLLLVLGMLTSLLVIAASSAEAKHRGRGYGGSDEFPGSGQAGEGWVNPIDGAGYESDFGKCDDGRADLGIESEKSPGADVHAIADGQVVKIVEGRHSDTIIVEHMSDPGGQFLAVYGNVRQSEELGESDAVEAGVTIGQLSDSWRHAKLYFAIRPLDEGETVDDVRIKESTKCHRHKHRHWRGYGWGHGKGWGYSYSYGRPNLLGYVDPFKYLRKNDPVNGDNGGPEPIDAPMCDGQEATIFVLDGMLYSGSDEPVAYTPGEPIQGTDEADVIVGSDDADVIHGRPGDDVICALAGDDTVDGNRDGDTIFGGPGNDTLRGLLGDDAIDGNRGDDRILGGSGNDVLRGLLGNDVLLGEGGDDDLLGGSGEDVLVGGDGDDTGDGEGDIDTCDVEIADDETCEWEPADDGTAVNGDGTVTMDTTGEDDVNPGTSLEGDELNIMLDADEEVSFEYRIRPTTGAVCGGGQPRIFIEIEGGGTHNSFDDFPTTRCGSDAGEGWRKVTLPIHPGGNITDAGLVFDNMSDTGVADFRNVMVGDHQVPLGG